MAWEKRRNGRQYYYRVQRIGERVVKTYVGGGAVGRKAAEEDEAARRALRRTKWRCDQQNAPLKELAADLASFAALVDRLIQYQLVCAGYRLHHREWRPPKDVRRRSNH